MDRKTNLQIVFILSLCVALIFFVVIVYSNIINTIALSIFSYLSYWSYTLIKREELLKYLQTPYKKPIKENIKKNGKITKKNLY